MHVKRVAVCAALLTLGAPLAGACGSSQASGSPESSGQVRMQSSTGTGSRPQGVVPSPPAPELSARLRDAKSDGLVATGQDVRVERVKTQLRLRITGHFRMMSSKTYVLVGGKVIGEGVTSRDLRSLTIAITDRSLITNGVEVAYSYGIGARPTAAGTLRMVK